MSTSSSISTRMLERVAQLQQSHLFKAAAAVSDAAMVMEPDQGPGQPIPQDASQQAVPAEMPAMPLNEELRARANDPRVPPEDQQLMFEAAARIEMVNAPSQAAPVPPPEAAAQPQAPAPAGAPAPEMGAVQKTGSSRWQPGTLVEDKDKQAQIAFDNGERPPTMAGFRAFLAQYS